jgi:Tripartite tricarboxylate transporter TctB family
MSRHAQENLVSVLLLALFIGVILLCQDFGPRARLIPLPLAIFGIVLTLIQLAWHNLGSTDELQMDMIAVQAPDALSAAVKAPAAPVLKPAWGREASAYGIIVLLVAMIFTVGLMPAVFVFTGGYLFLSHYCSWRASVLYTAVLTAVVYLLFVVALQIQPYHGLLAPLFQ